MLFRSYHAGHGLARFGAGVHALRVYLRIQRYFQGQMGSEESKGEILTTL